MLIVLSLPLFTLRRRHLLSTACPWPGARPHTGARARRKLARPTLIRPVGNRDVLDRRPRACRLLEEGHELVHLLRHLRADRQAERLAFLRGDRGVVSPGSRGP